jgi:hypothetical protein
MPPIAWALSETYAHMQYRTTFVVIIAQSLKKVSFPCVEKT